MDTVEVLKIGDVVNFNSGSPDMTVTDIDNFTKLVSVSWIDGGGAVQTSKLPKVCLKKKT